jgi:tetratricopeptide (TPR) repeat protein
MSDEHHQRARGALPRGAGGALPIWKRILFSGLVLAIVVVGLEGALALAGLHPLLYREDPYVGFADHVPLFVKETGAGGEALLVTAPNKRRFFNTRRFRAVKPRGARRIFCVGGSTTYGRPYDDALSFCGWLRAFLGAAEPDTNWEVVNAGGISYASYRVARVVQEIAGYQPDLLIIYSGHNEFLERRTYRDLLQRGPALRRLETLLGRTRLYTAVHGLLAPLRDRREERARRHTRLSGEVEALLDRSVGPSAYSRDDRLRDQILEHYRFNLERMVHQARAAGAEAILVAPASNLKDCTPFKSDPGESLSTEEAEHWRLAFERGGERSSTGAHRQARDAFLEATRIDPRNAEAHFQLGRARLVLGETEKAQVDFRRARDEDICPLRALTAMREILAGVARELEVPLVDFQGLLERESRRRHGHAILGAEFFLDHVHPTLEGNRMLGLALLDAMTALGEVQPAEDWGPEATRRVTEDLLEGIDPEVHAVALRNLAKVLSWAGKAEEAARLAERALQHLPEDPESHFILGSLAADRERYGEAIEFYRAALRVDGEYAKARNNLGIALARIGRVEEAILEYQRVLRSNPENLNARYNLANALSRSGRLEEALARYLELLRMDPDDADAHFNLARAYRRKGDSSLAVEHYREVLRIDPADADAHAELAGLLEDLGLTADARDHREEADRLER